MQVATATGGGGRAPRGPLHPTSRPRLRRPRPPPCRGAVAKAVFCYCYVAWVSTLRFFENRKPTKPNKTRHRVSRPSSQSNQRQRQAQVEVEVRTGGGRISQASATFTPQLLIRSDPQIKSLQTTIITKQKQTTI